MPSCTLEIGGIVVALAEAGPFDAEYALFEAHEIELRSNNEPGTVREHGYRTTADLALERLEAEGVTAVLAESAAEELGALATAYARGPEVRRVAALLGPCELFAGRVYHARTKGYEGEWLDVGALATDVGLHAASRAIQGLHLAALLRDVAPSTELYLATTEYTQERRPGERTHRRVSLASAPDLPAAIRALAERPGERPTRDAGPTRAELLESVRARLPLCMPGERRTKLETLVRMLSVRDRPQRGPLADADLWALELQLGEPGADTANAIEKLDALDRTRGRQPATAYLRARAALVAGVEDPRAIAERVSSLVMSMSAFAEAELLAAEAWQRAGDRKRALAYAHDLVDNPQADPAVRARARAIVAPPASAPTASIAPGPESGRASAVPVQAARASAVPAAAVPSKAPEPAPPPEPEADSPSSQPMSTPMVAITAGMRGSIPPLRRSSSPAAPPSKAPSSQRAEEDRWAPIAPTPILSIEPAPISVPLRGPSELPPAASSASPPAERAPSSPSIPPSPAASTTRPSMRAPPAPPPSVPRTSVAAPASGATPSRRPPSIPDTDEPPPIKGGSQPPFRTEPPPANFPASPLVPRLEAERVEKAETLTLPPGLHGETLPPGAFPSTPFEARIYFTQQSRELGTMYRQRSGIELRTDVRSIEIMQRHLAEHFESGEIKSFDDVIELRLHGAFLSEILARRLGAEWTDLGVSEMGYWAMNVPTGTTVWPIGRVVRFVTMKHRERDLVSYFLELQARAHGLR